MSDSNRTAVRVVEETTFAQIPANPVFQDLRIRSPGLGANPQTIVSRELAADRQVPDLILVGKEAGGDVATEFSFDNLHGLMAGIFWDDWSFKTQAGSGTGVAISGVSTTVFTTGDVTAATPAMPAWSKGMLARASGFVAPANNALWLISAGTATSATTSGLTADGAPAATARLKHVGIRGAAGDLAATAGPNVFTISASTGDWTTYGLAVGQWVKASGFVAEVQNNGWYRISAITATALTFDRVPTGYAAETPAGSVDVWVGDRIRNGTVTRSYTFEVEMSDLATPEFHYYRGCKPNLNLEMPNAEIVVATVSVQGAGRSVTTTRESGATTVAATTHQVMNTADHVARMAANGTDMVGGLNAVLSASISIDNNLRRKPQIGSVESAGIGGGRVSVTGRLTVYYGDNSLLTKLDNGTADELEFRFEDNSGTKAYTIDLPQVKYSRGDPSIPGIDTDRTLPLEYQAIKDPVLGYTVQLGRFEEYQ